MLNIFKRIIRVSITLIIALIIVRLLCIEGYVALGTITTIVVILLLLRFTTLPYKIIAGIFRILPQKSESASITVPFLVGKTPNNLDAVITVPNIPISKYRQMHELDHVRDIKTYIVKYGRLGTYIFCLDYLRLIIWYGYDNEKERTATAYADTVLGKNKGKDKGK